MNREQAFLEAQKMYEEKIAELKQQLEEVQDFIKLFDCDNFDEFKSFIAFCRLTPHEQETLILNLQKQLHTQPKEIVEKIKGKLQNYILAADDLAFETYIKVIDIDKVLNEILKGER